MEIHELREKLVEKKVDLKKAEGLIADIFKNYRIENTIAAFRILYGYLLSYAYFETEEANDIFENLIIENNTFELSQLAKSVLGDDVVSYYERLLEIEHLTSLHPIVNQLEDSMEALGQLINDSEESFESVSELINSIK